MSPVLVFDIETVPDVAGLRKLYGTGTEVSDRDVAAMAFQLRRQASGHDFLPLHLHRVIVISCALHEGDSFKVWSLGGNGEAEGDIIQRFFDGIEKYTPQLVSWNGSGFDMPVLHYRGLIHAVRAPRYWDTGDDDREFRFNNYISRYHMRHCDVMDLLALYQGARSRLWTTSRSSSACRASSAWMARRSGTPTRPGASPRYGTTARPTSSTPIWFSCAFRRCAARSRASSTATQCELVRATLGRSAEPHWREFLSHWSAA